MQVTIVQGLPLSPMDEVQRLIDVNFFAAVRFVQAVLPSMKKLGRGYIFNIASLAGVETFAEVGSYSGSKFALVGYQQIACSGTCSDGNKGYCSVSQLGEHKEFEGCSYEAGADDSRLMI